MTAQPETADERILLRTKDVYQTESPDDVTSYSDELLAIVADFRNSGEPEGSNAQSMAGKSKRGEVACRLFARIGESTGIIETAGFKARGCLAMTACASAACLLIEGKPIEEALRVGVEDIRTMVGGVPAGKTNALHFATCAIRGLVGDFLIRQGASTDELTEAIGCDEQSLSCLMAEHCSYRQSMRERALDEAERRRESLLNVACADVFSLVRHRTSDGLLTSPADWANLVPACCTPDEFTALIFSQLSPEEEVEKPAATVPVSHDAPRSAFANRGVGIPNLFASSESRERNSELNSASSSTDKANTNGAADIPAALADTPHVFDYSRRLAPMLDDDDELTVPDGYELVEIDGVLMLAETETAPEPPQRIPDAHGIRSLEGTQTMYLYDASAMTSVFAAWALLVAEGDALATFATCVREDSRTYPRPMAEASFANRPFCMGAHEVRALWEQAQHTPGFEDIAEVEASNGDRYYYSRDFLQPEHAKALAEWESVERLWNV